MGAEQKSRSASESISGQPSGPRADIDGGSWESARNRATQDALLQRVVEAADSYASAVKVMHSFPPDLPIRNANGLVENAFSALRSAREDHLFSLLEAAAGAAKTPPAFDPQGLSGQPAPQTNSPELVRRLTAREREIVKRVAEGMRSKEIAHALGISPKTVVTHRSHIMDKLGVHDSTGLVRFAIRAGLCKL